MSNLVKVKIRICVSHMCMITGKEDLHLTAALKEEFVKAIVLGFPCLAIPVDSFNFKSYTNLHDSKLTNEFVGETQINEDSKIFQKET